MKTGTKEPAPLTADERAELVAKRDSMRDVGTGKTSRALAAAIARLDFLEAQVGPKKMGRPAGITDKQVITARRGVAAGMQFMEIVNRMKVNELALRRAVIGLTFRHITDPAPVPIPSSKTATQTVNAPRKKR